MSRMSRQVTITLGLVATVALAGAGLWSASRAHSWTQEQRRTLQSLSIDRLPALPPDPSNRVADDARAVKFGHKLFFDTKLSANGKVACASCHQPQKAFNDGLPLAKGVGRTDRKTMTVIGTAYSPYLFWDGRKDSQWAQALGPLESAVEHGGDRTMYARLVARHYRREYEAIFGPLPDLTGLPDHAGPVKDKAARANWERLDPARRRAITRVYANIGKAIAAYERRLNPGASRFDRYVEAVLANDKDTMRALFNSDEVAGLRLFIGKANCTNCHNGPLLTNQEFHNTGIPAASGLPRDVGRATGAPQVLRDEFNCLSEYSDAKRTDCTELRFLKADGHELERAFKVPSLRNVARTAPYMHAGQKASLKEVLRHYNEAPAAPEGHSELQPLHLTDADLDRIEAFLGTLDSPVSAPAELLRDPFATP
ncbi:cytochrome-c peroxidase [Deinococcus pimensis]|uniref:cytochrome-c peroxidase n=1 Tax=Deinococcus pimensis TaxID=309888 RepID=UPI0004BBB0D0|nr:cytochrome c peroxidase [Deinococcus pimensis]